MFVKFFPHGKSTSKKPHSDIKSGIRYLTATRVWDSDERAYKPRSVAPIVVQGNPEDLQNSVAYGNHTGRYTSGVLRFVEKINEDLQNKAIEGFQNAVLPGLDPSQYHALWVRHEDKGGLELHFMIGGEELGTGKRLNAYYAKVDQSRINHWKNYFNARYDLADPNDPLRKQTTRLTKNLPQDKKNLVIEIDDRISTKVENGEIHNRKNITNYLKELNLEVARETKSSISIKDPNGGKQNIRLKGAFYEQSFSSKGFEREQVRERVNKFQHDRQKRAGESFGAFKVQYRKRAEDNKKKYKKHHKKENLLSHPWDYRNTFDWSGPRLGGSALSTRKDDSEHIQPKQKPYTMQRDRDNRKQPESMPTTIEGEDYGEEYGRTNNGFYQQFWDRLHATRRRLDESFLRLANAYQNLRREPVRSVEKLRHDGRELQNHGRSLQQAFDRIQGSNEAFRRNREKTKQVVKKLERKTSPYDYPTPKYHPDWQGL